MLIKKQTLISVGGYDDGSEICQDLRTWEKIIKKGHKIYLINEHLTYMTIHNKRITGTKESRYQAAIFYIEKFKNDKNPLSLLAYINNFFKYIIK